MESVAATLVILPVRIAILFGLGSNIFPGAARVLCSYVHTRGQASSRFRVFTLPERHNDMDAHPCTRPWSVM
ncbi:hypothetical protein GYMLUDRAFT_315970 [Collybiopsis luxurians FD-317 M1]|nr:hypothetical protein GYMLUDRAFT_315970 [Collybiopsis luxurians FD-317 M1]